MKTTDTPITFIPPPRTTPAIPRARKIRRVALVTVPYHSGVVESAGTWLNVGFVYKIGRASCRERV